MYYDQAHVPWDRNFTGRPHHRLPVRGVQSADPRDKRFRSQMLAHGISHLDAILLTHNHKDHTGGLDNVRPDVQPAYDGLTLEDA